MSKGSSCVSYFTVLCNTIENCRYMVALLSQAEVVFAQFSHKNLYFEFRPDICLKYVSKNCERAKKKNSAEFHGAFCACEIFFARNSSKRIHNKYQIETRKKSFCAKIVRIPPLIPSKARSSRIK